MRSLLIIVLSVLTLSGCSVFVVAEKEQKAAERLYIAETLCMRYKWLGSDTSEYNMCIANVLGIDDNQKSNHNDPIRAGNPVEASGLSDNKNTSEISTLADAKGTPKVTVLSDEKIVEVIEVINALPKTASGTEFVAVAVERLAIFDDTLHRAKPDDPVTVHPDPPPPVPDHVRICDKYNAFGDDLRQRCEEIAIGSRYEP